METGSGGDTSPAASPALGKVFVSGPGSLSTCFTIGSVLVPNRVVLAPVAGLTTSAYRQHLKAHGAGLVTTEMVSAYGLCHGNRRTHDYVHFHERERPVAVQLFGDAPDVMAEAARLVLSQEPVHSAAVADLIDINMGCPVRKVMRTGAGAALLAEPDRAVAVAAAVVEAADELGVPVTVKLRSGVQEGERTVVELALRLEKVGVAAIGVHPRAAVQYYRGQADHTITAEVVQAVSIPVIASGDVMSVHAAHEVLKASGAEAVMVARGVAGDPWLLDDLLEGAPRPRPALPEVVAELRALLALVIEEMGPQRAVKWMWRPVGWYLRPSGVAPAVVERLRRAADGHALDDALAALRGG